MIKYKISPQKIILIFTGILFGFFLLLPMVTILYKSFFEDGNATLEFYATLFSDGSIVRAFRNSVFVSSISGIITTILAFILRELKKRIKMFAKKLVCVTDLHKELVMIC